MLHHEQGSMAEHLRMLLAAVQSLREREGQPRSLQVPHSKAQELGSSIRELEQRLGSLGLYCSAEEEEEEGGAAATLLSLADRQLNGYSGKAQALPKLCEALARKLSTFENIVCVLNREVEKSSLTLEAYSQQHPDLVLSYLRECVFQRVRVTLCFPLTPTFRFPFIPRVPEAGIFSTRFNKCEIQPTASVAPLAV
ncbi:TNF receptor-associated factor 2 [Acipenser ruthenus]|uniref:TNF receptor-associated factor 2 n=1 Tax=Acipenser ruthenus TaxID=7906 RepID=A0A444U4V1_ACIRT|nr:TNF receptor-associated factor 2 [Acipenser ruthenus]